MLCPKCGKETGRGLCKDCFLELNPLHMGQLEIPLCQCGRYLYQGKWRGDLEENLEEIIKENLKVSRKIKVEGLQILSQKIGKKKISLEVEVKGKYQGKEISQKIHPRIKIKREQCEICKKRGQYYEAVVQFRNFKPQFEINPERVSNIKRRHGGVDFYLTTKGYAQKIARKFRKKDFQVKESETLTGVTEHGKRKSRLTISIKPKEE